MLIFGSGVAVGWGVTSHEIALPGALARALALRSGRGADVEIHADMRITSQNALSVLRGLDVSAYDVIILVLGANDAIRQTPLVKWRTGISTVLAHLEAHASVRAQFFVVGIPPIRSIPGFAGTFGGIATQHAADLNRESQQHCVSVARAEFIPLLAAEGQSSQRYRDGRTYRCWAMAIAEVVAPTLHIARWGSSAWDSDFEDVSAGEAEFGR
ncbi:MAG: GDSL-type esterase/lipase family protein [Lacisediminihabitans sp.]